MIDIFGEAAQTTAPRRRQRPGHQRLPRHPGRSHLR
jgi:hypothetical protein